MRRAIPLLVMMCVLAASAAGQSLTTSAPQSAIRINGVLFPPLEGSRRPLSVAAPLYPKRALDRQKEGFVEFEFTINPDGTVANPKIINEYPEHMGFRESAKEAFRGFTFAPDIVDGSPIATPARYRMVFKMH